MTLYRICVGLLLLIVVPGCQSEKPTSAAKNTTDASTNGAKLVVVSLGLNWKAEAEHGGFYSALVHGYYADEGLNVTIHPGGPGVPVIADVASGKVEFGVDNADKLLLLRAQQADVVAVMSPMQNSPRCIMVHKKSGLGKLEEIEKKKDFTLAINQGQPFAQYLLKKLNLNDVRVIPYSGGIANFLESTDFGQQAYSFSEPFTAEKQGGDPRCLMLSDVGFNTYTSILLTRGELIEQKSDLVSKMTRASIRGWKRYLVDPDKANEHIHKQNPEMDLDTLAFGAKALRAMCLPYGFEESRFGEMSAERWQTLVSQMVEIEQIKRDSVKAEEAFSLKYLGSESK